MSERIVRFVKDADLVYTDKCEGKWIVTEESRVTPLMKLANYDAGVESDGYFYRCPTHNTLFSVMGGECPGRRDSANDLKVKAGEEATVSAEAAEWLVQNEWAVYPTHIAESVQGTIDRTNALMDSMGLPQLDAEAMRTVGIEGKRGRKHYARPSENRLASDLGLSADDIADMRKLGATKP